MKEKFFGIYDETDTITEVFVFDTAVDRDRWVNFQDDFSEEMHITADNCIFRRAAVTADKLAEMLDSDEDRENLTALLRGDYSHVITPEIDNNIKMLPVLCCC